MNGIIQTIQATKFTLFQWKNDNRDRLVQMATLISRYRLCVAIDRSATPTTSWAPVWLVRHNETGRCERIDADPERQKPRAYLGCRFGNLDQQFFERNSALSFETVSQHNTRSGWSRRSKLASSHWRPRWLSAVRTIELDARDGAANVSGSVHAQKQIGRLIVLISERNSKELEEVSN